MSYFKPYQSVFDRFWPRVFQTRHCDRQLVRAIRARTKEIKLVDEASLEDLANELRQRINSGADVMSTEIMVEAFSLATEAVRRIHGKIYYDVQLLGGLALASGSIAEMQTGEGKTITCGLAAVLYGLTGRGVHVATTNDYLAQRDHEELLDVFRTLGITTGLVHSEMDTAAKRLAYQCDVTYGTGYDFGFDFLRDQLALRNQSQSPLGSRFLGRLRGFELRGTNVLQRKLAFAIIDEADSVLIDEAATPLILSGASGIARPVPEVYLHAMQLAGELKENHDYELDRISRSLVLTETGFKRVHQNLPLKVQRHLQRPWSSYVEHALHARHLLHPDSDYVVEDDQVIIVDQNTGRLHEERKWRSGLHQAVEMKEGVTLTDEREIEARITRQRYFRFYEKISGMTGTANGNQAELREFYQLPVVQIPRNQPSQRKCLTSRFFVNADSKLEAIATEALQRSRLDQPVLVGTRNIGQSRQLSELLMQRNIGHAVLNGIQDESEAEVIARAGGSGPDYDRHQHGRARDGHSPGFVCPAGRRIARHRG